MKRSEINSLMKEAADFAQQNGFKLPPFAFFSKADWENKGAEYDELRDNMLGWDITDFGSGDFEKIGLLLFTLRNGNPHIASYKKPYAEKIMVVKENQVTPYHFHFYKMEDIINRGGGNLCVKLYNATEDEALDEISDVLVSSDGRNYSMPAGCVITLAPGQSVTLTTRQYHSFWGEEGKGTVLVGEVSMTNDDFQDNRFLVPTGRFPEVEEDEEPLYLMSKDTVSRG